MGGTELKKCKPRTPQGHRSLRPWGHQHWVCTSLGARALRAPRCPTPPTRTEGCGGFREGLFMGSPPGPVAGGAPRVWRASRSPMSRRRVSPLAPCRSTRPARVLATSMSSPFDAIKPYGNIYVYAEGCPHGTHTQVGRPTHESTHTNTHESKHLLESTHTNTHKHTQTHTNTQSTLYHYIHNNQLTTIAHR